MAIVGIGIDIVEIARIENQLSRSIKLAERVLTTFELERFNANNFPARFLAKRFAAKEAIVKAVGTGIGKGIGFQQMEIDNLSSGQPVFRVSGMLQQIFTQKNIVSHYLSIADEQHYAVAQVVLES